MPKEMDFKFDPPFHGYEYGFPACRLLTRITSKVMQRLLDVAKHTTTSSGEDIALSLLSKYYPEYELRKKDGKYAIVNAKYVNNGRIIGTTCKYDLMMMNSDDSLRCLAVRTTTACKAMNIACTSSELKQFVYMLYYSIHHDCKLSLSYITPVKFLPTAQSSYLTVALSENTTYTSATLHKPASLPHFLSNTMSL